MEIISESNGCSVTIMLIMSGISFLVFGTMALILEKQWKMFIGGLIIALGFFIPAIFVKDTPRYSIRIDSNITIGEVESKYTIIEFDKNIICIL